MWIPGRRLIPRIIVYTQFQVRPASKLVAAHNSDWLTGTHELSRLNQPTVLFENAIPCETAVCLGDFNIVFRADTRLTRIILAMCVLYFINDAASRCVNAVSGLHPETQHKPSGGIGT